LAESSLVKKFQITFITAKLSFRFVPCYGNASRKFWYLKPWKLIIKSSP